MRKEYQRKTANMQDSSTTLLEHVLQSVFFASGSIFESKFAKPIAVLLLLNIFIALTTYWLSRLLVHEQSKTHRSTDCKFPANSGLIVIKFRKLSRIMKPDNYYEGAIDINSVLNSNRT